MERKGIERSAALFRRRGLGLFWTFTSGMAERGSEISVVWGQMRQQKQRGVKSARLPRLPPNLITAFPPPCCAPSSFTSPRLLHALSGHPGPEAAPSASESRPPAVTAACLHAGRAAARGFCPFRCVLCGTGPPVGQALCLSVSEIQPPAHG